MTENEQRLKLGLVAAVCSQLAWGFLPIYWKLLSPIDSTMIIFYRIVLVVLVAFIIGLKNNSAGKILSRIKDWNFIKYPMVAGVLITINWSVYIWAVNNEMIIETSIGYYIEPLIVCICGFFIFKENPTKYKIIAIVLATIAVGVIIFYYWRIPVVALTLAMSFALYAVMKKKFAIGPILSLFYETVLLVPIAIVAIIYLEVTGQGAIDSGATIMQFALLSLSGFATLLPLGLFAYAAMNIPLISLGLSGYIAPTVGIFIGVFLYGEHFSYIELISFGIIWIGLAIFTYGEYKGINSKQK